MKIGLQMYRRGIRINDRRRVCFVWSKERGEAVNIEIVDYLNYSGNWL